MAACWGSASGVPGSVDSQASGIVDAPTLGWHAAPVGPACARARDPGSGRQRRQHPRRRRTALRHRATPRVYLVVTIGRGIGCGIVVDSGISPRRERRGRRDRAHPGGTRRRRRPAPAATTGCLEAYIGADRTGADRSRRAALGPRGTIHLVACRQRRGTPRPWPSSQRRADAGRAPWPAWSTPRPRGGRPHG